MQLSNHRFPSHDLRVVGFTSSGVPYPTLNFCHHFEGKPDFKKSVWALLDLKIEWITYDLRVAMFEEWTISNVKESELLTIDSQGNCNMPIQEIDAEMVYNYLENIFEWLKGIGGTELTFCETSEKIGKSCRASFATQSNTETTKPGCPFARIMYSDSMKWSCCHTVKVDGVMLKDIQEVFAECIAENKKIEEHERGDEVKRWLNGMMMFLKNKLIDLS